MVEVYLYVRNTKNFSRRWLMAEVTAQELQSLFQKDLKFFIEWSLSVVPMAGGKVIPFKLNAGQQIVVQKIQEQLNNGKFVRAIVLKSRRQGISTLGEAIMYAISSLHPNRTTLVLAHDKDTSAELFRIAQGFYETDRRHEIGIAPKIAASNERALRFGNPDKRTRHMDPGLRSSMLVETAEGRGVGRGLTLMGYHWAEVAYTKNQEVSTGLNIACSKVPGSIGIWESTANGSGDAFERNWNEAVDGSNDFLPIFLPWNIDPNCARTLTREEYEKWHYRPGEEALQKEFSLTLTQLKFRRVTIASPECFRPGVPPEDVFRQEYPLTPEEAFLKRGKNFFLIQSLETLKKSERGVREPMFRAEIKSPLDPYAIRNTSVKIIPKIEQKGHGPLVVWELPVEGADYVIGADPSAGLSQDSSVALVLRRDTLAMVARFGTKNMDPDEFGVACALLGWWYQDALIGIERNGPGAAANKALRQLKYPRPWYDRDIVNINEPVKNFMGWSTTSANRRPMLDRLEESVRRQELKIPSASFYEEARNFIMVELTNPSGSMYAKPVAAPGCHDDEIMSLAIALQMHLHGGAIRGQKAKVGQELNISKPVVMKEKKEKKASAYDWW
jgi:hypothetical protein